MFLLSDFCRDTNFKDFFNNHIEYYNSIIDETILKMGNVNFINELEEFYGIKQNSYNVILVSLYLSGGYGPKVHIASDKYEVLYEPIKVSYSTYRKLKLNIPPYQLIGMGLT